MCAGDNKIKTSFAMQIGNSDILLLRKIVLMGNHFVVVTKIHILGNDKKMAVVVTKMRLSGNDKKMAVQEIAVMTLQGL